MARSRPSIACAFLAVGALVSATCTGEHLTPSLTIATTTSVDNSGLLRQLLADFEASSGITVNPIVVGSGKAIRMARDGQVEMILTHDPEGEKTLVASRRVLVYRQFMTNDFAIAGPVSNRAGLVDGEPPAESFRKIAASESRFCSRNDHSGTHVREMTLWSQSGIDPRSMTWYYPLGQGMSALLRSADELEAYLLTDRATFLQLRRSVGLRLLSKGHPEFRNTYAITLLDPGKPTEQSAAARQFTDWLLGDEGRRSIERFRIDGEQVFFVVPGVGG